MTLWKGLLAGTGTALPINPALWFFTAIFMMALFYRLLQTLPGRMIRLLLVTVISLCVVAASAPGVAYWWNVDIALACLLFYAAGDWLKRAVDALDRHDFKGWQFPLLAALLFMLSWLLCRQNGPVDISQRSYGVSTGLFFLSASIGVALVLTVSKIVPANAWLTYLSQNSLSLFALHMVAYRVFTGILVIVFHQSRSTLEQPLFAVLYVAWALSSLYPVIWFLKKHAPILVAGRPARAALNH